MTEAAPSRRRLTLFARLPPAMRFASPNGWAAARRNGDRCHSFLEGPCLDPAGRLLCVDIANGRILRVADGDDPDAANRWSIVHGYDGWPTGLKCLADGSLRIADNRLGLLALDEPAESNGAHRAIAPLVDRFGGQPLHGANDLTIAADGSLYFTDQGESDLLRRFGRVLRRRPDGRVDLIADGLPSPNGLALSPDERLLYVAVTQANAIWRIILRPDDSVGKVGLFVQLSGSAGGGPDGLAVDAEGSLYVCHALAGCLRVFDRLGEPIARIDTAAGLIPTNLAFGGPDRRTLFVTEAETGTIQTIRTEVPGLMPPPALHGVAR
ncbi:MAG: SMP-30/gluconolactonase/LRE family protein [Lautropia sp.]